MKLDFENMAGQSHSTNRRAKKVSVLLWTAPQHTTIRDAHAHPGYMIPKATIHMVVLSMYIGGHHPPEGDKLSSRRNRNKKQPGQKESIQLKERETRFSPQ